MPEDTSIADAVKTHRYRCPGCGADLLFEPQDGMLACPYCGRREQIAVSDGEVGERSYEDYLRVGESRLTTLAAGALEVKCETCGATVTFTPPEVAGECDFCGGKIVAQPKSADPIVAPEAVLPFLVTQTAATESIRKWLASLWFAPNALKKFASHETIGGVYIPFWTYDAHTSSRYTGERGEHYFVEETYVDRDAQGNAVNKSRRVRQTRWHRAEGDVARWFDDLLVPATKSLSPQRLDALNPWDLPQLKPYEPAYLSGFKAQRYQVDLAEGFEMAKRVAAGAIDADVRRDIGGDEQRIGNISTHYSAITFKHLLLPVYVGAYRFNGKVFQLVVNGRTGEVQGERPYSFWKILLFVLVLLVVVGLALVLLGGSG